MTTSKITTIPKVPHPSIYGSPFRTTKAHHPTTLKHPNTPILPPKSSNTSGAYDELIRVTLDLDTTKELLEREQLKTIDVQRAYQKLQQQHEQCLQHIQTLQEQLDQQTIRYQKEQATYQSTIQSLQQELQVAQLEANDAIDICCMADTQKQHVELQYQTAVQTIQSLQEQLQELQQSKLKSNSQNNTTTSIIKTGKHVHFQEDDEHDNDVNDRDDNEYEMVPEQTEHMMSHPNDDDNDTTTTATHNSALVTYGKQLLSKHHSTASSRTFGSSDTTQRREQLRQRLLPKQIGQNRQDSMPTTTLVTKSPDTTTLQDPTSSQYYHRQRRSDHENEDYTQLDTSMRYHHIMQMLQCSGQALQLSDQRYFVTTATSKPTTVNAITNHSFTSSTPTKQHPPPPPPPPAALLKMITNGNEYDVSPIRPTYSTNTSKRLVEASPMKDDISNRNHPIDLQAIEALTKHYTTMVEVSIFFRCGCSVPMSTSNLTLCFYDYVFSLSAVNGYA